MSLRMLIPSENNNAIATIAIGEKYYNDWLVNAYPSWKRYCLRHGLGLIVVYEDLISKESPKWKKATWQKLLLPNEIRLNFSSIKNVCYLDTDILINHYAPNVFDNYNEECIGLVSVVNNIPFDREDVHRRVSFLRHKEYDSRYPLDSSIFMSINDLYEYHDLNPQNDFACMGFIVFNVSNHKELMEGWFNKYDSDVESITDGGDQTHINYEVQSHSKVSWFDYKFQAIWNYEISIKYPFLYGYGRYNTSLIRECVEASLQNNYFLHFAGSWYESDMWKLGDIFLDDKKKEILDDYYEYLKTNVTGKPKGQVKP